MDAMGELDVDRFKARGGERVPKLGFGKRAATHPVLAAMSALVAAPISGSAITSETANRVHIGIGDHTGDREAASGTQYAGGLGDDLGLSAERLIRSWR